MGEAPPQETLPRKEQNQNSYRMRKRSRTGSAKQTRRALSLFSGCGGLDLGLELAGWEIIAQVEKDRDAADTLRHHAKSSRSDALILQQPIESVSAADLRVALGIMSGELEMMVGGRLVSPSPPTG